MDTLASDMTDLTQNPVSNNDGVGTVSISASMIFSQVMATLATEIVEQIPGDKGLFLKALMPEEDLGIDYNTNTGAVFVYGMLDEILKCRDKLTELLIGKESVLEGDESEELLKVEQKSFVDVAVGCDILTDPEVKSKDDPSASLDNVNTVIEEEQTETYSAERTENKQDLSNSGNNSALPVGKEVETEECKVVSVSKRGRLIKRSIKLDNVGLDSSKSDEDITDEETYIPEKRPRKVGPKKRLGKTKHKDKGKISVDEVRRLVQEEKEKEEREKGNPESDGKMEMLNTNVLQNIFLNSLSDLQVQEVQKNTVKMYSELKASESKKKMKKYYEDRMPFKYFCDKCSFKSKRESHYQSHVNLHLKNPDMEMHKCNQCDFVSVRQSVLQRHLLTHSSILLNCSICSYMTNNYKQLEMHRKKHTKKHPLDFIPRLRCSVCSYQTLSKAKLIAHMELHNMADGEPVFKCDMCKYKTNRKEHLVRHQNNVHSNKRPFLCDLCGAAFKRVDALAAHKTTHLDKSKRKLPHLCTHCKKAFKSKAHLKEHMSVHTNIRSFQCHICGQLFKTRAVQRRHQQSIHFNPRSHKCTHCQKDFNTKYAFKRHLRIHDSDATGHLPTQVQPQVTMDGKSGDTECSVDESISAIQTITIAPENFSEFTQQLQNVSDQLHSATDIGEIYIQGIDGIEAETINIVNVPGQDVRQIFIPNDSGGNAVMTNDQIKQIFITAKSDVETDGQNTDKKFASSVQSDLVKQILIASNASNMDMAGLKELYVQSENGSEPVRHILLPSVQTSKSDEFQEHETMATEINSVEDQNLMVQDPDGQEAEMDQTVEAEVGGQTYQIKLENGQAVLTLGSTAVQNL